MREGGDVESFVSDLFYACRSEVKAFCNVHKDIDENKDFSNW